MAKDRGPGDTAAKPFEDEVWNAELDAVADLRRLRRAGGAESFTGSTAKKRAHHAELSGLACSGGGIRSATYNLGVIQGLARLGLLRRFDYLSTVSGGGYIGSWLTSWIKRQGFDAVEARLPREHTPTAQPAGAELAESPVSFLRAFSNYLTPRVGALSADTWSAVATYLRNMLLNLTVVIAALAGLLVAPRVAVLVAGKFAGHGGAALAAAAGLLTVAIVAIGANVVALAPELAHKRPWFTGQAWVQVTAVVPLFLGAWLLAVSFWFLNVGDTLWYHHPWWWAIGAGLLYFACWLVGRLFQLVSLRRVEQEATEARSRRREWRFLVLTAPIAGAVGGLLLWGLVKAFVTLRAQHFVADVDQPWSLIHVTVGGAPAIVLVFILTAVLHIGLMGREFSEPNREWWSRLGGWLLIYGITWTGLMAMAFYGPVVLIWLGGVISASLSVAWLVSTVGGILVERRAAPTTESQGPSLLVRLVRAVVPQLFVVGLLALLSLGLHAVLDRGGRHGQPAYCQDFWPQPRAAATGEGSTFSGTAVSPTPQPEAGAFSTLIRCHSEQTFKAIRPSTVWLLAGLIAGALLLSWRVDINQFSMHLFYRNRLIRAYLGASNPRRRPQPFTGFDPWDDFPLADLAPPPAGQPIPGQGSRRPYDGPYHLVNATLNLVSGEELAWQQRKGTSFLFSPLYTGFVGHGHGEKAVATPGFRPTRGYETGHEGISLGMAMGISGAAVSPGSGASTTAAMAFLLTVFDARLGWWLGNPTMDRAWARIGPDVGLFSLLAELFSFANDRSRFVYLSDGGHFENLGIYELVRRRCRFILASDGSADAGRIFGSLGNAVRKCRTDFGVPIDIDLAKFEFGDPEKPSRVHCAVGTIHYDAVDGEGTPNGTILYLKTALTGDEAADVLNYQAGNKAFPNQSTADQFFDESQFESYRQLGEHTAGIVFEKLAGRLGHLDREELCRALQEAWCPPDPEASA